MSKRKNQQQLQISTFIKQPASLKLLILAGTNIKTAQLLIVTKCTGLIKLDLSSNYLSELPLKFSVFTQMKILYLHDNQLTHVDIKNTQLEYISLFKNPIQLTNYRRSLIMNNQSLIGIDYNVITMKERYGGSQVSLPIYSQIKWPIVEISTHLEHEDDYLNLLKAEIFVIGNVQKRTLKIETIEKIMLGIVQARRFNIRKYSGNYKFIILPSVVKAAKKWKQFTKLKRKLRLILQKKNKQHLIYTKLEINKLKRSSGVNQVMDSYLPLMRMKLKIRDVIQRRTRSYRAFIPAQKQLESYYLGFDIDRDFIKNPIKLYFRYSELDILSKVCLYAKKLFFKQKDYDLCDEFNNLFKQTKKKYYIFRKKGYLHDQPSWVMNSIHQTSGYVLSEVGLDRQHFLYSKKGHKSIGIKPTHKFTKTQQLTNRISKTDRKIQYLFDKYDKLIEYEVSDWKIMKTILRIIRFMNAGNSQSIILTQTAYFQTQVIFQDKNQKNDKVKTKFHIGLEFFVRRVVAANVIQKSWRKYATKKKNFKVLQIIKKQRAQKLISKWIRSLIFTHRLATVKTRSYYSSSFKEKQIYMQLQIYMNMPNPTNYLRFALKLQNKQDFYDILHKGTEVQIIQANRRRWVKIRYSNSKQAASAQNKFLKYTYCYLKGFYLRLFTQNQINDYKMLEEYEKNVLHLYKIHVNSLPQQTMNTKTTLWIDNNEPYFIWSEINAAENSEKFQKQQKHNTNVNIFIYNKHKRPLKVSCQLYWAHQDSLYQNRKSKPIAKKQNIPSIANSPAKQNAKINFLKDSVQGDLSLLDLQIDLKHGQKKGKGKYLFDKPSKIDRSQQKQHRRSSVGKNNSSLGKSIRSRIVSDHKLEHLAETLNIRKR